MKHVIDCRKTTVTIQDELVTVVKLTNLEESKLETLNIVNCVSLSDFSFLTKLTNLKSLTLKNLPRLTSPVEFPLDLVYLHLINLPRFKFITPINKLTKLMWLTMYELPQVQNLTGLNKHRSINILLIRNLTEVSEIKTVTTFSGIDTLSIVGLPKLYSVGKLHTSVVDTFRGIDNNFEPTNLELGDLPNVKVISDILMNSSIRKLSLYGIRHINDLRFISTLSELEELSLGEFREDCLLGSLDLLKLKVTIDNVPARPNIPCLDGELFTVGDFTSDGIQHINPSY